MAKTPRSVTTLSVVDSHTGGEPTRVIDQEIDLGSGPLSERRTIFKKKFDWIRSSTCTEPRASEAMVGALLTPPTNPDATAGVIFFNNVDVLGMCGHGTIGVVATLAHLGRIKPGPHRIETPVGDILATLHDNGEVSVRNVASYRYKADVELSVPGYGNVVGDIAYGGNWFFLVKSPSMELNYSDRDELLWFTKAIRKTIDKQKITGASNGKIDHIELYGNPSNELAADSRNFVLCPGGEYDRSPCGTGTSAKVAVLAAEEKLAPGEVWRQESITGSIFQASYAVVDGQIIPTIRGSAFVTAVSQLIIDPADRFAFGIPPR
ncbi:proline racemase family protein [Blastopirellula sp. JC732]|uniref:Proline racemase family protein n=1 Tax=Blastopirellula sediminis TaxID=2894196 RepID=A0A9X1MJM8_9BACT|nr:proline racemase family protein [Blastopirellula sediminis]MCC9608910.1 proline racemase family protein [Blastopirellula sediminis]MCC9628313.1 proline racemase family protein [Blastopirellula sediminis]